MVHSAGILAGAASANAMFNPALTLGLFTVGTVVFSGRFVVTSRCSGSIAKKALLAAEPCRLSTFSSKYLCVLLLKPYYPMFANEQLLCLRAHWRPSEREVRSYRWLRPHLGMAFHHRVAIAELAVYCRCFHLGLDLNLGSILLRAACRCSARPTHTMPPLHIAAAP